MELTLGYKRTEIGMLPESWELVPFADILDFRNGLNADKSAYGVGTPFANVFEIINNSHLQTADIPGRIRLPPALLGSFRVLYGDALFNRSSETQEEVGLAATYMGSDTIVFGGFVIRARPKNSAVLDPLYSGYALRSKPVRKQIVARGQGAIRANIGQQDLRSVLFPRPPLPEQRTIAGALSDVDALLGALDRLIAKKRDLKQAAVRQLLTGQTRLPGFTGKWETKRIGDLAQLDPEQLPSDTKPDYEFKYISLEDVDLGSLRSHTTQVFRSCPSRARRKLLLADVLVSTVRPNLKSHLWFKEVTTDWICSTGFAVVRCRENVSHPGFIFAHLFANGIARQIDTLLTGSNYPAINSRDVRQLELSAPAFDQQAAIAGVLVDMDAELVALEQRRDKTRLLKQGMMQELLTGRTRLV